MSAPSTYKLDDAGRDVIPAIAGETYEAIDELDNEVNLLADAIAMNLVTHGGRGNYVSAELDLAGLDLDIVHQLDGLARKARALLMSPSRELVLKSFAESWSYERHELAIREFAYECARDPGILELQRQAIELEALAPPDPGRIVRILRKDD